MEKNEQRTASIVPCMCARSLLCIQSDQKSNGWRMHETYLHQKCNDDDGDDTADDRCYWKDGAEKRQHWQGDDTKEKIDFYKVAGFFSRSATMDRDSLLLLSCFFLFVHRRCRRLRHLVFGMCLVFVYNMWFLVWFFFLLLSAGVFHFFPSDDVGRTLKYLLSFSLSNIWIKMHMCAPNIRRARASIVFNNNKKRKKCRETIAHIVNGKRRRTQIDDMYAWYDVAEQC